MMMLRCFLQSDHQCVRILRRSRSVSRAKTRIRYTISSIGIVVQARRLLQLQPQPPHLHLHLALRLHTHPRQQWRRSNGVEESKWSKNARRREASCSPVGWRRATTCRGCRRSPWRRSASSGRSRGRRRPVDAAVGRRRPTGQDDEDGSDRSRNGGRVERSGTVRLSSTRVVVGVAGAGCGLHGTISAASCRRGTALLLPSRRLAPEKRREEKRRVKSEREREEEEGRRGEDVAS